MTKNVLLLVASVAALGACNRAATNNSTAAAPAATANSAAPAAPAAPAAGAAANPQLQSQLAQMAQLMQGQLPMTQQTPNGPLTFTAMEARGNELVTSMTLPVDVDEATFGAQFGQVLPAQACANPQMAQLVRSGAVITYVVTDSEDEEFTASVRSC